MSAGWHSRILQIFDKVEKRIARAFPVFRIDKFAKVMPIFCASSVMEILRSTKRRSRLTLIGKIEHPILLIGHFYEGVHLL